MEKVQSIHETINQNVSTSKTAHKHVRLAQKTDTGVMLVTAAEHHKDHGARCECMCSICGNPLTTIEITDTSTIFKPMPYIVIATTANSIKRVSCMHIGCAHLLAFAVDTVVPRDEISAHEMSALATEVKLAPIRK